MNPNRKLTDLTITCQRLLVEQAGNPALREHHRLRLVELEARKARQERPAKRSPFDAFLTALASEA